MRAMGTPAIHHPITPEEYLEQERKAEFRSEYVDGVVYEMSGGSYRHAVIISNVARSLGNSLEGSECAVVSSDMRVWIPAAKTFCYPDSLVICGQPRFSGLRSDIVENPLLIIEVLSDSTETYDRGQKFRKYRSIPDLRQYVLISQREPLVEVFTRDQQGFWLLREYAGLESTADLDAVQVLLPLQAIYQRVVFEPVTE